MTAPLDRAKGPLAGFVRWVMWRVDYHALYPAKVVSQNGDYTLELQPDSARLSGMSRIPIRYGIPGVKAKVAAGARVAIGFDNGDPDSPYAALFETQGLVQLDITISGDTSVTAGGTAKVNATTIILNDGEQPIARQGDLVQGISTPPGSPFVGIISSGNGTVLG